MDLLIQCGVVYSTILFIKKRRKDPIGGLESDVDLGDNTEAAS